MIGKITDVPWAVVFPRADMAPRHPVQLYQALCEGPILAGILLYAMRCDLRPGQRGSLFLVSYGALRLVTEAFREVDADYLGLWHGLTSGQLLSGAMILVWFSVSCNGQPLWSEVRALHGSRRARLRERSSP
jgi:phosphatidylglycerol:prolipoprotein diacylglycerol transferase